MSEHSWQVLQPGARLGICGTSGVGKSRFFRWLLGLEERREWEGVDLGLVLPRTALDWQRWRMKYQLVPQRIAAPAFSVREYVQEPWDFSVHQKASPLSPRDSEFLELVLKELMALGLPGKEDFLARPMNQLSGGELSRVALARVLLLRPEFLILDELTAALDVQSTARVEARLKAWWEEQPSQRGWMLCSHDLVQLERLCGRVVRLEGFGFHALGSK